MASMIWTIIMVVLGIIVLIILLRGALWVDIDAGQIDGENDRKRDICLYP